MSNTTKYKVLSAAAAVGLLGGLGIVAGMFPRAFQDRLLLRLLAYTCVTMMTAPIWFRVNRYLMKRYDQPHQE